MAFLRNRKAPASAPGGHEWPDAHKILEVVDHLAHELLHIADGGFEEVLPTDVDHPQHDEYVQAEKDRVKAVADAQKAHDKAADDAAKALAAAAKTPIEETPKPAKVRGAKNAAATIPDTAEETPANDSTQLPPAQVPDSGLKQVVGQASQDRSGDVLTAEGLGGDNGEQATTEDAPAGAPEDATGK
jgi:hypothetical protein